MEKIAVGMSGGVDSSVSALLLKEMGYDVLGVTLALSSDSKSEAADSKSVCDLIGARHILLDLRREFFSEVIEDFINSYKSGGTPNPCIVCNKKIKFGIMLDRVIGLGCSKIATGHYARIENQKGRYIIKKALDITKDQSYVLYGLSQDVLSKTVFPLGEMTKEQVREIAEKNRLVNAKKKDSQDICFVPDGDYAAFIESRCPTLGVGDFVTPDGRVLGRHKGITHYTIGQRKHLGISVGEPIYVVSIDPDDNTVVLGDESRLFGTVAHVEDFNWISGEAPDEPIRCKAKTRYRQTEQPAVAVAAPDGSVTVTFDEPVRAITPGQSCVLYDGDVVLGGGVISR
jgi:tRNA-specific 2-thiouridylase